MNLSNTVSTLPRFYEAESLPNSASEPKLNEASREAQKQDLGQNQQGQPDMVSLSPEALAAQNMAKSKQEDEQAQEQQKQDDKKIQELKDRDREVRLHEQAHAAVGGQYAGAPSYDFETGPDGKQYAVGGEVSIDVSEEEKPEDTIDKMQTVRAAALAPAEPSPQDFKVASEATQKEQAARAEVAKQSVAGEPNKSDERSPNKGPSGQNTSSDTSDNTSNNISDSTNKPSMMLKAAQTYQQSMSGTGSFTQAGEGFSATA